MVLYTNMGFKSFHLTVWYETPIQIQETKSRPGQLLLFLLFWVNQQSLQRYAYIGNWSASCLYKSTSVHANSITTDFERFKFDF